MGALQPSRQTRRRTTFMLKPEYKARKPSCFTCSTDKAQPTVAALPHVTDDVTYDTFPLGITHYWITELQRLARLGAGRMRQPRGARTMCLAVWTMPRYTTFVRWSCKAPNAVHITPHTQYQRTTALSEHCSKADSATASLCRYHKGTKRCHSGRLHTCSRARMTSWGYDMLDATSFDTTDAVIRSTGGNTTLG